MVWATVFLGSSEENGSWKMICIFWRMSCSCLELIASLLVLLLLLVSERLSRMSLATTLTMCVPGVACQVKLTSTVLPTARLTPSVSALVLV